MKYLKHICFLTGLLISLPALTQIIPSQGIMNMTPAEMEILMETILEAKQRKIRQANMAYYYQNSGGTGGSNEVVDALNQQELKNRLGNIEKMLIQIKEKQNALATSGNNTNNTPDATANFDALELTQLKESLLAELRDVKKEIEALPDRIPQAETPVMVQPTPSPSSLTDTVNNQQQTMLFQLLVSNLDSINRRLTDLQQNTAQQDDVLLIQKKLDELVLGVQQTPDLNDSQKLALEQKLNELQELIKNNQTITNTKETNTQTETIIKEKLPTDEEYLALKKLIEGKEKSALYFDNNSSQIKPEALTKLSNISELLKQNERLDVMIAGFASEKGTPIYNEALSQNRTEAVKKHFMKQGISARRIFTEYHGIDYNVSNPSEARRVEVVLMIGK